MQQQANRDKLLPKLIDLSEKDPGIRTLLVRVVIKTRDRRVDRLPRCTARLLTTTEPKLGGVHERVALLACTYHLFRDENWDFDTGIYERRGIIP